MMKGGDHIESDFYTMIKSKLTGFIRGNVYREGKRPINAETEDAVVSFKTGLGGQFQDGEVVVNVYVPDISGLGKDITRCREIGNKLVEVIGSLTTSEYLISLHNIPQSFNEVDIKQHFVNARIRFKRITV